MKSLMICDDCQVDLAAPLCRQYGAGIEVQAYYDPYYIERFPESVEQHKKAIAGIKPVAVHGAFGDLIPGSFDHLVSDVARQRIEQSYKVAVTLGAGHLILHHGFIPHTSKPAGWVKRSAQFWQDFLAGKDPNIKVHLENVLELDPKVLHDTVRTVNRSNIDVILDIGHIHCNTRSKIAEWIEYLGPLIGYVHLHDNHGQEDEHLGLGKGTLPVHEVLQMLKTYSPNAIWALEAKGEDMAGSLDWLKNFGFLT
jgi:sugar phosphate isomerase/epimerase